MKDIILKDIVFQGNLVSYHFQATGELRDFFNSNILWIEYGEDMSMVPESILTIPFVSIMFPIIWVTDSVLWVKEIDKTFYNSTFNIRRAYQELYPMHPLKGRFVPAKILRNTIPESKDAFVLFSGGIDAHTTYLRHKQLISHLVNIQGFFKNLSDQNTAAEADCRDIARFAKLQNKHFDYIKSNFALIVNTNAYRPYAKKNGHSLWHGFQHSMAFISISIPLAFKLKFSKILIASSFTIGDSRVCASYPTTDSEFSFALNGETMHDGFELSRQDKIKVLVNYQNHQRNPYPIRVCSFNDHNCCECEKCFRTVLGLVAEAADVRNFDFYHNGTLKQHWKEVLYKKGGLMGFKNEKISHWPYIIARMKENYHKMTPEQKEFVDWFLTFDFDKAKKEGLRRYYRQNFFSILKRKLHLK